MSIGGGSSKSSTSSNSMSQESSDSLGFNRSTSFLDANQAGMQQSLYDRFNATLAANGGAVAPVDANPYLENANAIATGNTNAQRTLGNVAAYGRRGMEALQKFTNPYNPAMRSQIANYGQQLGKMYREQILPGIGSNFGIAGQRGSSRQGIAEATAANDVMTQFNTGATNMLAGGYQNAQQAAAQVAQLGGTAAGQAGELQLGGTQAALGALPGINAGAIDARNAAFSPFAIGAGIVGSPTALTSAWGLDLANSRGMSTSSSRGKSSAMQMSAGIS